METVIGFLGLVVIVGVALGLQKLKSAATAQVNKKVFSRAKHEEGEFLVATPLVFSTTTAREDLFAFIRERLQAPVGVQNAVLTGLYIMESDASNLVIASGSRVHTSFIAEVAVADEGEQTTGRFEVVSWHTGDGIVTDIAALRFARNCVVETVRSLDPSAHLDGLPSSAGASPSVATGGHRHVVPPQPGPSSPVPPRPVPPRPVPPPTSPPATPHHQSDSSSPPPNMQPTHDPDRQYSPTALRGFEVPVAATVAVLTVVMGFGVGLTVANRLAMTDEVVANSHPVTEVKEQVAEEAPLQHDQLVVDYPTAEETVPPLEALDALADVGGATAKASLEGQWVPQLSSKRVGMEAEGIIWDEAAILADHERLKEQYPEVLLVWSGEFQTFSQDDFWVTIVGFGYADAEDALMWCSSNGLGADHCYAKRLSTYGGPEGSTRFS